MKPLTSSAATPLTGFETAILYMPEGVLVYAIHISSSRWSKPTGSFTRHANTWDRVPGSLSTRRRGGVDEWWFRSRCAALFALLSTSQMCPAAVEAGESR
jgi:hypothetical protein